MAVCPNPIIPENFSQAWQAVSRKNRTARVKAAIRKIAKPFAEFLFFPLYLILSFGAASTFTTANVQALIGRIPVLPQLWAKVQALVFGSAEGILEQSLMAAAFLYAIPFAVYLLVAAIIALVYHPRTPAPSGALKADAQDLWTLARNAQMNARSKGKDFSGTLALIAGILAALAALTVIFYWLLVPGAEDLLAGIGVAQALKMFALALILIFSYGILMIPLDLLMKLVHMCHVSKRTVQNTELFFRSLRVAPAVAPVAAPEAPAEPTEAPAEPAEAPAEPAEAPAEPAEAPAEPAEAPAEPAEAPAEPVKE